METSVLLAVAIVLVAYGLVSRTLSNSSVSGPLVFTAVGVVLSSWGFGLLDDSLEAGTVGTVETLAEATLVILLFADATRIDLRALRHQVQLPARLLAVGLPLTVLLGTVLAVVVFGSQLTVWEAALLAAVLTPTDAALGQAVVGDPRVPVKVRQALNVESGLNDGLMVPVITVLVAIAGAEAGLESPSGWGVFALEQIGFGVGVGLLVGLVGGRALDWFSQAGRVEGAMRQIVTLALAVAAFAGADALGGNGFVASFVAGMAYGWAAGMRCHDAADFAEDEGQLLTLLTFGLFGAVLLGPRLADLEHHLSVEMVVYVLGALTVVRIVPVAISLLGARLAWPTVAYLGWFGPRGLASIVFGLVVAEELETPGTELLLDVVVWAVVASTVLHGLTAVPGAGRYADWFQANSEDMSPEEMAPGMEMMPEAELVQEMRARLPMADGD